MSKLDKYPHTTLSHRSRLKEYTQKLQFQKVIGSSNLQERCANQNIKAKFKNALFITSNTSLPYSSVEKEAQRSLERD